MRAKMNREGSIYPEMHPPGTRILARVPGEEMTSFDQALVAFSSLFIVGSVAWVPLAYAWAWKRWNRIPKDQKRRRMICAALLLALPAIAVIGPHRTQGVAKRMKMRRWNLWRSWLRFVAFEVVADSASCTDKLDLQNDQVIFTIIPHGLFPFALGIPVISDIAAKAFGYFRPIVATATSLFPFLRTILAWVRSVDASRSAVDRALANGDRIGLAPGGIAEMFVGYPKPGTHPDEEYAILRNRKGIVRMAVKHGVPLVPVYCFGATKMMRRLQLPPIFERLSNLLRISICIIFGVWGLPVPFRQRLLYVIGEPIFPPTSQSGGTSESRSTTLEHQVDDMHSRFCDEILRLFERHKFSYGWDRKTLKLV